PDFPRHARYFRCEQTELIDHRVDGVFERKNLSAHIDGDLFRQVAIRNSGSDFGDVTYLRREIPGHRIHTVGQILPSSGYSFHVPETPSTRACPPRIPSEPTSRATRVTSEAKERSWSTITLTVSFSSRNSPLTSTVIFLFRSPFATAVVTVAMLRTCAVRLPAMRLTFSVKSFQVPATRWTFA